MIKPMNGNVLVEYVESADNMLGGIIIPETANRTTQEAIIVAVGGGKYVDGKKVPIKFKVGDRVFVNKHTKTDLCYDDKDHILIKAEDILAKTE